jgi:hypothetical protein
VPFALKKLQKFLADFVAAPELFFCARAGHFHVRALAGQRLFFRALPGHVSPSFAGFNPQIIADAA